MEELLFHCPYCWLEISTVVETSTVKQQYIEDCEECSNPLEYVVDCESDQVVAIRVNPIAQ